MSVITNIMPAEGTLGTTDVEELLINAAFTGFPFGVPDDVDKSPPETHTFKFPVSDIQVVSDLDTWIALASGETGNPGAGNPDVGRVFVPAATPMAFTWKGRDVFFLNVVTTETPTLRLTGFALRELGPEE